MNRPKKSFESKVFAAIFSAVLTLVLVKDSLDGVCGGCDPGAGAVFRNNERPGRDHAARVVVLIGDGGVERKHVAPTTFLPELRWRQAKRNGRAFHTAQFTFSDDDGLVPNHAAYFPQLLRLADGQVRQVNGQVNGF